MRERDADADADADAEVGEGVAASALSRVEETHLNEGTRARLFEGKTFQRFFSFSLSLFLSVFVRSVRLFICLLALSSLFRFFCLLEKTRKTHHARLAQPHSGDRFPRPDRFVSVDCLLAAIFFIGLSSYRLYYIIIISYYRYKYY